tara:strand:- start:3243 stop:4472 length:1230 start_codon:yes stop_codon:yes gene_type:complete
MQQTTLTDGLINGIGGTIGGGVFLLVGELVQQNRNLTYLAFVIGALMCLLVAFCYSILSKEYPSEEGTTTFSKKVFPKNKKIQKIINGLICFGYTSLLCVYSLSAGSYLGDYLNLQSFKKIISSIVIAICVLLSYMPKKIFNSLQSIFVAIKLIVLIFVGLFGIVKKDAAVEFGNNKNYLQAMLASLNVFVSFEGFEMNSGYSKSMKDVDRNLPLSYFMTIIVSALVYIILGVAVEKHVGSKVTDANQSSALIDLVKSYGSTTIGPIIIVISNLIANISANIATISTIAPMIDDYVKDIGLEKGVLGNKVTVMGNSQSVALILSCTLAIILMLFGKESLVKNSGSLSFLVIFTMVCYMTYVTINKKEKKKEEITVMNKPVSHKTCKIVSQLGGVCCLTGTLFLLRDMSK